MPYRSTDVLENSRCVKSVRIRNYSGPKYLSVCSPNVGKCGPE